MTQSLGARASIVLAALLVSACASNPDFKPSAPDTDPWEKLNRSIYTFNDTVDRYSTKPIAKGYRAVLPQFMRTGVTNLSNNLREPRSALNNLLQGKPGRSISDLSRFVINSTAGVAGLIDWATMAGIERYDEDFGQTLAVWGVPDGPFVVIPILGPSTLRDAIALPIDIVTDAGYWIDSSSIRDKLYILRTIDLRYRLLTAERFLEDAKDPYITIRESFLQNRQFQIADGNLPEDEDPYADFEDFEDFDDLEDESATDETPDE